MKRDSAFKDWFVQQYGSMPSVRKRSAAWKRKWEAEVALTEAQLEYALENAKFEAFNNALYGWNARVSK